jgi:hypothetical protein
MIWSLSTFADTAVRLAGQSATLILLAGCMTGPVRRGIVADAATSGRALAGAARLAFSEEDFCPARRVSAQRVVAQPAPRPAIASDPERLAMWQRHYDHIAETTPKKLVMVEGCGDRAVYACWDLVGVGASCMAEAAGGP